VRRIICAVRRVLEPGRYVAGGVQCCRACSVAPLPRSTS
jgi:hypothetical protein